MAHNTRYVCVAGERDNATKEFVYGDTAAREFLREAFAADKFAPRVYRAEDVTEQLLWDMQ